MSAFLAKSNLSRGDLRIFLSNENGHPQDAISVLWTVLGPDGTKVSGNKLPAVRAAVGEYYAPWYSDVRNGNYTLEWVIKETWASDPKTVQEKFFVVDPSSYRGSQVLPGGMPLPGGLAYLSGTSLGPQDLTVYLRDDNGILTDALAVFWTISDSSGRPLSDRMAAPRSSVGTYWAPWYVNLPSGAYSVLWEFQRDADSPMQSARLPFSVVNPASPYVSSVGGSCLSADQSCDCGVTAPYVGTIIPAVLVNCAAPIASCSVNVVVNTPYPPVVIPAAPLQPSVCCTSSSSFEIPRTVHLSTDVLPPSGSFTDQGRYAIPHGVRHITFYISYARGAAGGHALFKLLWGNGTEESQETVVDTDIDGPTIMGQQGMFLQDLTGPMPVDDATINFVLYVSVPGGAKTTRLLASEAGVPGIPGTVGITLTASSS